VTRVEAAIKLLEDGSTVPFIARYRKEATGNLDEARIREIDELRVYYSDLDARRARVLGAVQRQGKLTDDLKQQIEGCYRKSELEDLYLQYRPKKKSAASIAIARGLEPLAGYIMEQTGGEPAEAFAQQFVSTEKEVPTAEEAVEGAL